MNALGGENLQVRLLSLEDPLEAGDAIQYDSTSYPVFDNVTLDKFLAGDANMDSDVDVFQFDGSGDAQLLSSNIGQTAQN